jgi:hypothetical protein
MLISQDACFSASLGKTAIFAGGVDESGMVSGTE